MSEEQISLPGDSKVNGIIGVCRLAMRLINPPAESDTRAWYWYRVRAVTVACTAFLMWPVAVPLAMGAFPSVFPGFARVTNMQELIAEVRNYRSSAIDDQLFTLRVDQCKAESPQMRQGYEKRIRWLRGEYKKLTGQEYPESACSNL
jgi:hypothetical protein